MNAKSLDSNAPHVYEPAIENLPEQAGLGPVGKGAIAAAGAFLAAAYPPAAVPLAASFAAIQGLGEKLSKIQEERTQELIKSAATVSGLTPDDVVHQLVDRTEFILLTAEAVDASRRSLLEAKCRALGRSLGTILTDDALIDLETVWVRVLSVVEPPHLRVLSLFIGQRGEHAADPRAWSVGSVLTVSTAGRILGLHHAVLPLVEDLIRCGLLMDPGAEGMDTESTGGFYEIPDAFDRPMKATSLARELMARLVAAGAEFN
jgi:hypothetical protein